MFCGCAISFGDEPNVHTCPICLAHPGVLPVPNEEAIRFALKIGMALGCEIAPRSIFHRKNYFYPDNPKAYQISQYDIPICGEGKLGDIRITRAHLEEDAAKTIHVGESGRIARLDHLAGRLQPRRHAAGRDRHRARPARRRRSGRVGAPAARDGPPARRLRREHGGGEPAGRRQRLGAPGRVERARGEDRAEEHELLPLPAARDRSRAGAPARADRRGGDGRAGDPPLRSGERRADLAALEGGSPRLPLLPRARPGRDRADRGDADRGARVAAGAARGAPGALRSGLDSTRPRRACSQAIRSRPSTSRRSSAWSPTGSPRSSPTG